VSKHKGDADRGYELADPLSAPAGDEARPPQDFVTTAATIGVIAAGVALFEVALIPGMVIGGAAVLAPKYLPKYLPKLRRGLQPLFDSVVSRRVEPAVPVPDRPDVEVPPAALPRFAIKQAVAKTITFRIFSRPSARTRRRRRPAGVGLRSVGRWRRPSPFGTSPRPWTSQRLTWWSANSPRR
jgi:hypothetical protein